MAAAEDGSRVVGGSGEAVQVPSGQTVTLQDVVWNVPGPEGMTLRFRFVAPAIADGGGTDFEAASADMQHLCDSYAIPRLSEFGAGPATVVISLSAAPVEFGAAAPDIRQYFESYSVVDGRCEWEMF
ncbi:MAG: hypothetical protein Q27BPR15_15595 [Rhodobacter sp. CACIA14H1]|nr:MAG: hypothetical protein Q27BPR15_15595 [Rhodobacter sp. CACIA14H1]